MVTSLLQGMQISLWGLHDNWGSAQILCLHASILLYFMARTGQSSQERLGNYGLARPHIHQLHLPTEIFLNRSLDTL